MSFRRNEVNRNNVSLGEGVFVAGGHLHVQDALGRYSIPIGRKVRKELVVIDENPGFYKRTLQIDLFTGFVYYCVDNFTAGGNAYYYDMPSKKVWNERVVSILRHIQKEELKPTAEEYAVFSQLPCDNWEELLGTLPGWNEILSHRLDTLLLPQEEVEIVRLSEMSSDLNGKMDKISEVVCQALGKNFMISETDGQRSLRYADLSAGAEFFGRDEEYERYLSDTDCLWLLEICEKPLEEKAAREHREEKVIQFLRRELVVME